MKQADNTYKTSFWLSCLAAVIIALLPFHALLTTWAGSNVGHFNLLHTWKEILICAMAPPTAWLAWRTPRLKNWFLKSWLARLIGLYFLLQIGLGLWAWQTDRVNLTALAYGLVINLRFLGFFLVCLILAAKNELLAKIWPKLLLIPAAVAVGFGVIQKLFLPSDFLRHFGYSPKTIPAYQTVDANIDYTRIESTLRGANPLGAYLVLIIPAFWLKLKRWWPWLVGLAAALAVLYFSFSRSAWVGLALSLVALAWLASRKLSSTWATFILIAIFAGSIVVYSLRSVSSVQEILLHTSSTSVSAQSSNAQRSQAIKNGLADIRRQPLGNGPGSAGPASFRNRASPRIAEDYYLQVGQEVGIAGLAIFVAIVAITARYLLRLRAGSLAKILLASLIGISFINLLSHAWTDDTLSLIWWGLAGIAIGPAIIKDTSRGRV